MTLARSAGSRGSPWAGAAAGDSSATPATVAATTEVIFMGASSAVLRTSRDDLAVRHREDAEQPAVGPVARTTDFGRNHLADIGFDVRAIDALLPEEDGRGALDRPGLHLRLVGLGLAVHEHVDVGIAPIQLRERAGHRHAVVEVEQRRHVVVGPSRPT